MFQKAATFLQYCACLELGYMTLSAPFMKQIPDRNIIWMIFVMQVIFMLEWLKKEDIKYR